MSGHYVTGWMAWLSLPSCLGKTQPPANMEYPRSHTHNGDLHSTRTCPNCCRWRSRKCKDTISWIDRFVSGCVCVLVRSVDLISPFQTLFRSSVNVNPYAVQKLISQTIWSYHLSLYKLERKSQHCDLFQQRKFVLSGQSINFILDT